MRGLLLAATVSLVAFAGTGCAHRAAPPATLYDDLGGSAGVARLADAFISRLAENPLVVDTFADTDMDQFRRHLMDQLCELGDGGCVYEGRSMRESHEGLNIEPRQFNATVEDLMQAMDDVELPQGVQNRLLKLLAPMYGDIVEQRVAKVSGSVTTP